MPPAVIPVCRERGCADTAVADLIGSRCRQMTTGARNINLIINESILPEIAKRILEMMDQDEHHDKMCVDAVDDAFKYEFK